MSRIGNSVGARCGQTQGERRQLRREQIQARRVETAEARSIAAELRPSSLRADRREAARDRAPSEPRARLGIALLGLLLTSHAVAQVDAHARGALAGAFAGGLVLPQPTASALGGAVSTAVPGLRSRAISEVVSGARDVAPCPAPGPVERPLARRLAVAPAWHAHKVEAATFSKIKAEYEHWKKYLVRCSDGSADVDQGGAQGVSEGTGYGMLMAVAMNDRATFDALLKGVDARANARGLMGWVFAACGPVRDATAAIDGDLDIAYALAQADQRWGGYRARAVAHIERIAESAATTCATSRGTRTVLLPWDNASGCPKDQRPTVNPSYFAPAYYPTFARLVPKLAALWAAVRSDSYALLREFQEKMDGLMPEWGDVEGTPSGGFDYNACRVAWRVATDYAWTGNGEAKEILKRFDRAVDARGGLRNASPHPNSCFVGGLALAATALDGGRAAARYREWSEIVGEPGAPEQMAPTERAYYQGTLRVLYAMLAGGHFTPAAGG